MLKKNQDNLNINARLTAASDKVYHLLAHGRCSLGTPAASTTKTGRHDIAESGVKPQKAINQSTKGNVSFCHHLVSVVR